MKLSILTTLAFLVLSANAFAADTQVSYSDATAAFETAKAPDMKIMSQKLSPIAFAIYGDVADKKLTSKIMKQKLNLKISTDALGKEHILDPDVNYNWNNEGDKKLELFLNENGLKGEVSKDDGSFGLNVSEECRQLENSNIICDSKFEIGDSGINLIRIFKGK